MNLTDQTLQSYNGMLKPFLSFCKDQGITKLNDVDNFLVDAYFADMSDKGHTDGGMHAYYRSLRSFMRWTWSVYNFNSPCCASMNIYRLTLSDTVSRCQYWTIRAMFSA